MTRDEYQALYEKEVGRPFQRTPIEPMKPVVSIPLRNVLIVLLFLELCLLLGAVAWVNV